MRTDAELLVAARAEAHAFRELYERYATRIYGYHLRCCRDPDGAHDLTAETFAQAWLSRMRFRDEAGGSAAPWLFAIARHVLLMSIRRRKVEESGRARLGLLEERTSSSAQSPDETWLEGLDEAFAALPEQQREAIELRVVGELPYFQVAEHLGTTPRAARVRVHRGLRALRTQLESKETGA